MGRLLLVLVLALAARPAMACPAGSPCLKYRIMRPPPPPVQKLRYARTIPATLDRTDRASIARFLVGSTWDLVAGGRAERIRFVDPTRIGNHFARPPGGERLVMIRELEKTLVGVDGVLFSLSPCRIGRTVTTCLDQTTRTDVDLYGGVGYGG